MNTKKGFTLVELLVVIAILAILATVSVVGYTSFITRAEQSNAETEAHQIETTIESYLIAGQSYKLGTVGSDEVYLVVKNGNIALASDAAGTPFATAPTGEVTGNVDITIEGATLTLVDATHLTYTSAKGHSVTITLNR
ncbi:MAG: type IV pilin protein [Eubacteriales bacterium]